MFSSNFELCIFFDWRLVLAQTSGELGEGMILSNAKEGKIVSRGFKILGLILKRRNGSVADFVEGK